MFIQLLEATGELMLSAASLSVCFDTLILNTHKASEKLMDKGRKILQWLTSALTGM